MADFRKRLIGFTGAAMLFSGIASAQFTCTTLAPTLGSGLIRSEGQTELIQQLTISGCAGTTTPTTIGTVQVFLSSGAGTPTVTSPSAGVAATSQVLIGGQVTPNGANQVVPAGATEAQLQVNGAGTTYFGTAAGGVVTFSNVNLSAGVPASMVISNIRINANALGNGPVPVSAFAYVSVSGATIVATTTTSANAALVISGLAPAKIYNSAAQAGGGVVFAVQGSPFGVCNAINNGQTGTAQPSFFVSVNETFAVAFKSKNGTGLGAGTAYASGSESSNLGVETTSPTMVNAGTRLSLTFTNIPTGMNVFVPLTVTAIDGAVLTNINSAVSPSGPGNNTTAATSPNSVNTLNYYGLTAAGGTATAYYEVTTDNAGLDMFSVPVVLNAATNAVVNQPANLAVTVSYAPVTPVINSAASYIPQFTTASTPVNILGFTLCQTSLLFPFVTNQAGFETGLAISNTTKDPTGTKPQSGNCTLNYYGTSQTNPAATLAPNNNEGPVGGPFASGESYAFTLTSALAINPAGPATFQGYIIAVCQFQDAHGFAYITYAFPGASSDTMGYLALVLGRGSNAAESLGH
ncbi:MAG: hypothetical protein ABJC09_03330 [Terriglobia bacterium]